MSSWWEETANNILGVPLEEDPGWVANARRPEVQLLLRARDIGASGRFEDYMPDEDLGNLLRGKRIAIVGPAHISALEDTNGAVIDSHDLVVKVHFRKPTAPELYKEYGERTDLLFDCLNLPAQRKLFIPENESYLSSLKYLVCPQINYFNEEGEGNPLAEARAKYNIPCHATNLGFALKMFKAVGTVVNTGLLGIILLLHYDIEELYITGMTFYSMGKGDNPHQPTKTYLPGYEPQLPLRLDLQNQERQVHFFKQLLKKDGRIILDPYLKKNFYA